jgi:hypothetical protein
MLPLALLLMAGCAAPQSVAVRAPLLLAGAVTLAAIAWQRLLTPEEKHWIMGTLAIGRVPGRARPGGKAVEVATGPIG